MAQVKVYIANLGFYEVAVAARSQKLALAHWGVTRDLFREGSASVTDDPKAIAAAKRKIGVAVRRPIGSSGPFEEKAGAERTLIEKLTKISEPPKRKSRRASSAERGRKTRRKKK